MDTKIENERKFNFLLCSVVSLQETMEKVRCARTWSAQVIGGVHLLGKLEKQAEQSEHLSSRLEIRMKKKQSIYKITCRHWFYLEYNFKTLVSFR